MNLTMHRRTLMFLAISALLAATVACSNRKAASKSNFEASLNSYFQQHPQCFYFGDLFPFERNAGQRFPALDALVDAGVLSRTVSGNHSTYDLTPKGREAWKTEVGSGMFGGGKFGTFCYGSRQVTEIEQFTEPATSGGGQVSQVIYKYKISNLPEWAKLDSVQKVYPELKRAIESQSSPIEDRHTLVLMNDGWSAGQ